MMAFTNLEKYVYSKKCLKQRRQHPPPPPTPPSSKVEGIFEPEKSPGYSCYIIGTNEIRGLNGCRSIAFLKATRKLSSNHGGR